MGSVWCPSNLYQVCGRQVARTPWVLWTGWWSLGEEADGGVSSRGEDPRLCWVKGHIEDAKVVSDHMTSEDLHRDDEWVLQQVTGSESWCTLAQLIIPLSVLYCTLWFSVLYCVLLVNSPVTDDDRSVIRCGSKQGVKSVIGHAPHRLLMVSVDKKLSIPLIWSILNNLNSLYLVSGWLTAARLFERYLP